MATESLDGVYFHRFASGLPWAIPRGHAALKIEEDLRRGETQEVNAESGRLTNSNVPTRHIAREAGWPDDIELDRQPLPEIGEKGGLFAVSPDDPSKADALFFSRYPTKLTETVGKMLGEAAPPGRSYPIFQDLGAKGIRFSVELFFYDAFIHLKDNPKATAALAISAKLWFERYVLASDVNGFSKDPVDIIFVWGSGSHQDKRAIPVVIHNVEMQQEHFDRGDNPQSLRATVDMSVNIKFELVSPFATRQARGARNNRIKKSSFKDWYGKLSDFADGLEEAGDTIAGKVAKAVLATTSQGQLQLAAMAGNRVVANIPRRVQRHLQIEDAPRVGPSGFITAID